MWGFDFDPKTSVVETHISRPRAKVDRPFDVALIHNSAQHRLFAQCPALVTEVYRFVAEDRGQRLATALRAGQPIEVVGDRDLLVQLYANLIENALRHCPAGSRIKLGLTIENGAAVATVEDNGPGIPAEERERVFRRLYRLEKSRTSPGTGLGLSLVRAIVDLHGGEIRIEDAGPGLRVVTVSPRATSGHQA